MATQPADDRALPYRGRFAPTPSGPLHFGSLVAALGSYLDARAHHGDWLVRIEDVDPPRVVPGTADGILRTLEAYGFEWQGAVVYQSHRDAAYESALARLRALGAVYACTCSRKGIADTARRGVDGPVYPGTCRARHHGLTAAAQRLLIPDRRIVFNDGQQGRVACDLARECGDFVLKRVDGVHAYHLAVVVDDAEQGITDIVRGADLLASTPRHLILQELLGYPTPAYTHLPVVLDARGDKLSKQTLAAPVDARHPLPSLIAASAFLGMVWDDAPDTLTDFWPWAVAAWRRRQRHPVQIGRAHV
jgi:glutamyl-Q tRNA(Asp) synthetase